MANKKELHVMYQVFSKDNSQTDYSVIWITNFTELEGEKHPHWLGNVQLTEKPIYSTWTSLQKHCISLNQIILTDV